MKHIKVKRMSLVKVLNLRQAGEALLALTALLLLASVAFAQGGYDISWFTVDGGGGTSSGAPYTLSGTAGQPDAGVLSGGTYALAGGFWPGPAPPPHAVYLPLVLRAP
jgi:hypothetical protein